MGAAVCGELCGVLTCVALIVENVTHRHATTQHNTHAQKSSGLALVGLGWQSSFETGASPCVRLTVSDRSGGRCSVCTAAGVMYEQGKQANAEYLDDKLLSLELEGQVQRGRYEGSQAVEAR